MPFKKEFSDNTNRTRKIVAVITIAFFTAIIAVITYFASTRIDELAKDPLIFREWINGFGFFGKFVFIGLASLQVILAIIPGGPVQIASGYAFGIIEGSFLCTVGIQLGSAIAFLLARHLGIKIITVFFPKEKIDEIKFLQNSKKLDLIVFVCFLIPGAPKDLLTYFCGITKISFQKFIVLTTVARIPSIVFSVMSGNALVQQDYLPALIIIVALVICSGAGLLIYKNIMKKESQGADTPKNEHH